jgi:uncharacterized protein YuzE
MGPTVAKWSFRWKLNEIDRRKPMKPTIKYLSDDNAAYIRLSGGDILESSEVAPNVVFDYDADGRIVGTELLNARAQLSAELLSDAA